MMWGGGAGTVITEDKNESLAALALQAVDLLRVAPDLDRIPPQRKRAWRLLVEGTLVVLTQWSLLVQIVTKYGSHLNPYITCRESTNTAVEQQRKSTQPITTTGCQT